MQKGVKRKADTTTFDDEGSVVATQKRDSRPLKTPAPAFIDYSQLKPRFKGKITERMKFCGKILSELLSKKCKVFLVFYI